MKTNYCVKIFGSKKAVKLLIVKAIRDARVKQNLSPEDMDDMLALGEEFATTVELEGNPELFHPEVLSRVILGAMITGNGEFASCRLCLNPKILSFLGNPETLDQVMQECLHNDCQVHMTVQPADKQEPSEFFQGVLEKIHADCPEEWLAAMDPAAQKNHGLAHVFSRIMKELQEIEI